MALTPEAILAIHKGYADEFSALAVGGLGAAYSALSNSNIYNYHPARINITSPNFGQPRDVTANLPDLPPNPTLPGTPSLFGFETPPNSAFGEAPASSYGLQPAFTLTNKPTSGAPTFDVNVPDMPDVSDLPNEPSYLSLPSLTLATVNIPGVPVFVMPNFEGRRPNDINAVDPNAIVTAYRNEQDSHRGMLTSFVATNADTFISRFAPEYSALRARINNAILAYTDPTSGGGAGVPVNVEAAIYARSSTRLNDEYQSALDAAGTEASSRGWTLPDGALVAAVAEARNKMGDALVGSAADIAIKNVELEQKQFQFMYTKGAEIETKMLDTITDWLKLALAIDAQSIESAKQIVAAYLGAYNIQVMVYKSQWDGYVADAQVLRDKIEALTARANLYRAQVDGELAKSTNNKAQADVIRAIAEVNSSLAATYKISVEAKLAPLEIQRLRLAGFEAQARVFASEVGAWESTYRAYVAEIEGETAKQKAWETRVGAYREEVGAWREKVNAYTAQVGAVSEINRAKAAYNDGQIRVWAGQSDQAIKVYEGLLTAYKAKSDVEVEQAKIEIEYWRTQASLIQTEWSTTLQQTFEFAREQMNLFRGQMEAAISAGNGLANAASVSGHLAGSAMSGLTSFAGALVTS